MSFYMITIIDKEIFEMTSNLLLFIHCEVLQLLQFYCAITTE